MEIGRRVSALEEEGSQQGHVKEEKDHSEGRATSKGGSDE
jgi:hypothetical protein